VLLWLSLPPHSLIVTGLTKNFTAFWKPCPGTCLTRIRAPPDNHSYLKPILSPVWQVFLRPLVLTATTKPHGVTVFKYISVPLKLTFASKLYRFAGLVCLKASPFGSSLISRRHRHNVSFASTPTVQKSWSEWEMAVIAECEWSR
jgi:hypothetical protein